VNRVSIKCGILNVLQPCRPPRPVAGIALLFLLCHRHMEERRHSSTIIDLGIRWKLVASFTLWPLYPWVKIPRYPLGGRLGGPKGRSGRCREWQIWLLLKIEPRPSSQEPLAMQNELSDSLTLFGTLSKWCIMRTFQHFQFIQTLLILL
jgi:hypothetical protein